MHALLKKMNFKGHGPILLINHPEEFKHFITEFQSETGVHCHAALNSYPFALVFVKSAQDILDNAAKVDALLVDDGCYWWAYPKKSSKRYKVDIDRDNGWQAIGDLGYEGVRQVAIDEDWSAVRFRKATKIKNLTRDESWRMSKKSEE